MYVLIKLTQCVYGVKDYLIVCDFFQNLYSKIKTKRYKDHEISDLSENWKSHIT